MRIELPDFCLVALVGASGSGKTTFARKHFKTTEVLGSDFFRALVSDDENNQEATAAAFESLYFVAGKRLEARRLTVIDATNLHKMARDHVLQLARERDCFSVAIVLDVEEKICQERNAARSDRNIPARVIQRQCREAKRCAGRLAREGFRYVHVLRNPEEIESLEITRAPLWSDKRDESGPFDVIGDVHGCYDELCLLLENLGYAVDKNFCAAVPPHGRKAVFLGDLCDRGPENVKALRLVMGMAAAGNAYCLPGNHDMKLLKYLRGSTVSMNHGLDVTVAQLEAEDDEFRKKTMAFLSGLVSHYMLDSGNLAVAHAGLTEALQGRSSGRVRAFCLYGETTGETDEFGLPERRDWAGEYRGKALVLYGHTPLLKTRHLNNTVCLDTGCVYGGALSAYRYPEGAIVSVPAARVYYEPVKPLEADKAERAGNSLDMADVLNRRKIETAFLPRPVPIPERNAAAALEVMERLAVDPRWLIYLPPTMSPCDVSEIDGCLEHPLEAFAYYRKHGVPRAVCEEKHMGSRAVIVLCRDENAAASRFGVRDGTAGLIYTRTGRRFFDDRGTEQALLQRLDAMLERSGFWEAFDTDWLCLDAEIMPWSAKAQQLLRRQYAPAGRAGLMGLRRTMEVVERAGAPLMAAAPENSVNMADLLERCRARYDCLERYTAVWRHYCWPVASVEDYRLAPFHVLATEGHVWSDVGHQRHLEVINRHMTGDGVFMQTATRDVDLADEAAVAAAVQWWKCLTESGGEGMVVKPLDFLAHDGGELLQPAIKCRGREYLRIIYGPEYDLPEYLAKLKHRSSGLKRRLALREFALGLEALHRFVHRESLHRVHECVFGVLALESEPVDPRL